MAMGLSLGSASVCLEGVGCLSLEIGEGPPRCDYMLSYDTDTSLLSHDYLTAKGGARRHDERRPPERVWRGAPGATWNVFRGLVHRRDSAKFPVSYRYSRNSRLDSIRPGALRGDIWLQPVTYCEPAAQPRPARERSDRKRQGSIVDSMADKVTSLRRSFSATDEVAFELSA